MNISATSSVTQLLASTGGIQTPSQTQAPQNVSSVSGSDTDGGPAAGNDHDGDDVGGASAGATTPYRGQNVNTTA